METYLYFDFDYPKRYGPFLERWKDIIGFELRYKVSDYGRVFTKKNNKLLSMFISNAGYIRFTLSVNGKLKETNSHRLVAEHFIDNPENKPEVNHIDGYKTNPFIGNLEWVTASENHIHAYRIGLKNAYQSRIVLDLTTGIFFDNIKSASIAYNINRQTLNEKFIKGRNTKNLILI